MSATIKTTHAVGIQPDKGVIVIPGEPQTRNNLYSAADYKRQVRQCAQKTNPPLIESGPVKLTIKLHYPLQERDGVEALDKPESWWQANVPGINRATDLILSGLMGVLYAHESQVTIQTTIRKIEPKQDIIDRWGRACRRGVAVVEWQHG